MLLFLKQFQKEKKYKLVRLDVEYSEVIDFTGKLYVPKTIQYGDTPVKGKGLGIVEISIAGNFYTYFQRDPNYNIYYLDEKITETEIEVDKGTKIVTYFEDSNLKYPMPIKFFLEKEIK
jgi:hypothetical protein